MSKQRLDVAMMTRGLIVSRSQAESYIRMGDVVVDGTVVTKAGFKVSDQAIIKLKAETQYVSRAALKLASVSDLLQLDFYMKTVLDVGSSTGGFTQYALLNGAKKVIAVEVGTDQLHPSLRSDERIELHEKTDIRTFQSLELADIVVADVSFISLREILPSIARLSTLQTDIAVMVKPQFEAGASSFKHKGVIKNDAMRRHILKDFENYAQHQFKIIDKADSKVAGMKGNVERFYLLRKLA
jgi:23S rRNA (cytidine1920-2'-O)/16S rRNA (cytidine1409-2'-O)-methyltransferase